ncbi:hypothetical protein SLA2020_356850 [Shorea laevis]
MSFGVNHDSIPIILRPVPAYSPPFLFFFSPSFTSAFAAVAAAFRRPDPARHFLSSAFPSLPTVRVTDRVGSKSFENLVLFVSLNCAIDCHSFLFEVWKLGNLIVIGLI